MNVLHITDLHLNNFEGDEEFLRKGFYREYIDRLFTSITTETEISQIDCIIISGDFIDKGKIENFEHVISIIDYLCLKFSINKNRVHMSIGNHDYKWKELENIDNEKENILKKNFKDFRNYYISQFEIDDENYSISKIDDNTIFLSLDSTWNSLDGSPGETSVKIIDSLVYDLRNITTQNTTLLIGCHFPIISFSDNFLASEEPDWHKNHVWIKANSLHDRLKRLDVYNIVWFHGDVHAGDARNIDKETFILTSKFGCKPDISEQRRQANLIILDENGIYKITCNYEFPTHNQNPSLGDWKISQKNEIRQFKKVEKTVEIQNENFNSINNEVEEAILRKIKDQELYQFGRFQVDKEYISLGWVDINKLLTDKDLLNRISDKCHELIKSKNLNNIETLFLGVEIIGGILASQLSVRFNVKNSIIPVRTKQDQYSEFEFSHSTSADLSIYKNIVIFIDIISSGKTINDIVNEILLKNEDINIHIISIISNDLENKLITIPKTKSYNSFCTKLKIPVIKSDEMPNEELVKPKLTYGK